MSATAVQPNFDLFGGEEPDGPALEERLSAVWETLQRTGASDCVICGGRMEFAGLAARCGDCGSVLS